MTEAELRVLASSDSRDFSEGGSGSLYEGLLAAILSGSLPPESRLPSERGLARARGISRERVREAFSRLEAGGFVEAGQGRVRRVRNLLTPHLQLPDGGGDDTRFQRQMMEVRALLEGECAWYAAQRASAAQLQALAEEYARMHAREQGETTLAKARADLRFHMLVAESSHNLLLVSFSQLFYARYFNAIYAVLSHTLKTLGRYPDGIRAQHAQIHRALQARDAEAARECAREHILYTAALLK